MEHNSVDSSELVLDLAEFHLHKRDFPDSSMMVCNVLVDCC